MPRVNRQRQRKQRRHQWNFNFNLHVPTVSWVLICFSIAVFYVAKGQWLWLIFGWLLLSSAAIYFNTYWYGDVKQLKRYFDMNYHKSSNRVLIIDASNSEPVKRQLNRFSSLSNVTITNSNLKKLNFKNGEFDFVLVHYVFQDINPRLTRIKAMQEAARVVKINGNICTFSKGFNVEQYGRFLKQSGFTDIQIKNNGLLGWWSGPWRPSFTITGKKG